VSARSKLSRKQEACIAALLVEKTHVLAADRAGVSAATLQRWLLLPDFQAAYRAARRQLVENALAKLQRVTDQAVETLQELLTCGHPPTQARTALGIIDHAMKAGALGDVLDRLDSLEREINGHARPDANPGPAADECGGSPPETAIEPDDAAA
jgi:hypothetical protein